MPERTLRAEQVGETRRQIMDAAERLFAEEGLYVVSNRQISAAAGQGNNAAVGYHFGTKADLVRAIVRRHSEPTEALRLAMVERVAGSTELRDWIDCLVRPGTAHLDSLPQPTWYARFGAQVMTDPAFRTIMTEEALATPALGRMIEGLHRCLPDLPVEVRAERDAMTRQLMVHMCAERERALADGTAVTHASWDRVATGLVDALTGLWSAPARVST